MPFSSLANFCVIFILCLSRASYFSNSPSPSPLPSMSRWLYVLLQERRTLFFYYLFLAVAQRKYPRTRIDTMPQSEQLFVHTVRTVRSFVCPSVRCCRCRNAVNSAGPQSFALANTWLTSSNGMTFWGHGMLGAIFICWCGRAASLHFCGHKMWASNIENTSPAPGLHSLWPWLWDHSDVAKKELFWQILQRPTRLIGFLATKPHWTATNLFLFSEINPTCNLLPCYLWFWHRVLKNMVFAAARPRDYIKEQTKIIWWR